MTGIVLDPAHGGHEQIGKSTPLGHPGPGGRAEKELTLALCSEVATRLGEGVALTRTGDHNASLGDRVAMAARSGASAFVSVHVHPGGPRGPRVWVHERAPDRSLQLAQDLARPLGATVHQAELAVLSPERHAANGTAACMIEIGEVRGGLSAPGGGDGLREIGGRIAEALAARGPVAPGATRSPMAVAPRPQLPQGSSRPHPGPTSSPTYADAARRMALARTDAYPGTPRFWLDGAVNVYKRLLGNDPACAPLVRLLDAGAGPTDMAHGGIFPEPGALVEGDGEEVDHALPMYYSASNKRLYRINTGAGTDPERGYARGTAAYHRARIAIQVDSVSIGTTELLAYFRSNPLYFDAPERVRHGYAYEHIQPGDLGGMYIQTNNECSILGLEAVIRLAAHFLKIPQDKIPTPMLHARWCDPTLRALGEYYAARDQGGQAKINTRKALLEALVAAIQYEQSVRTTLNGSDARLLGVPVGMLDGLTLSTRWLIRQQGIWEALGRHEAGRAAFRDAVIKEGLLLQHASKDHSPQLLQTANTRIALMRREVDQVLPEARSALAAPRT